MNIFFLLQTLHKSLKKNSFIVIRSKCVSCFYAFDLKISLQLYRYEIATVLLINFLFIIFNGIIIMNQTYDCKYN